MYVLKSMFHLRSLMYIIFFNFCKKKLTEEYVYTLHILYQSKNKNYFYAFTI